MSATTLTWGASDFGAKFFNINAGTALLGNRTISYTWTGADAAAYTTKPASATVLLNGGLFNTPVFPTVAHGATTAALLFSPNVAPFNTVQLVLTAAAGITPNGTTLTWAASDSGSRSVTLLAGPTVGARSLSFAVASTDAAAYTAPSAVLVTVTGSAFSPVIPPVATGTTSLTTPSERASAAASISSSMLMV